MSSQIAKGGTQDLSFFTQGRPVSMMESYKAQGHGMMNFIKENYHGKFSSMSNQMGKGMRAREAVIEMTRPHPVKYSGRERFLREPFRVRFIAVVPKF
jgi:hypothetical protein